MEVKQTECTHTHTHYGEGKTGIAYLTKSQNELWGSEMRESFKQRKHNTRGKKRGGSRTRTTNNITNIITDQM